MRLGWTQPYMSRRLTGEIPFDVADLDAIANLLSIPPTAFFQRPRHTGPRALRGASLRSTIRCLLTPGTGSTAPSLVA
jgi:transcriptional regulator with XRE-family HTH domain